MDRLTQIVIANPTVGIPDIINVDLVTSGPIGPVVFDGDPGDTLLVQVMTSSVSDNALAWNSPAPPLVLTESGFGWTMSGAAGVGYVAGTHTVGVIPGPATTLTPDGDQAGVIINQASGNTYGGGVVNMAHVGTGNLGPVQIPNGIDLTVPGALPLTIWQQAFGPAPVLGGVTVGGNTTLGANFLTIQSNAVTVAGNVSLSDGGNVNLNGGGPLVINVDAGAGPRRGGPRNAEPLQHRQRNGRDRRSECGHPGRRDR